MACRLSFISRHVISIRNGFVYNKTIYGAHSEPTFLLGALFVVVFCGKRQFRGKTLQQTAWLYTQTRQLSAHNRIDRGLTCDERRSGCIWSHGISSAWCMSMLSAQNNAEQFLAGRLWKHMIVTRVFHFMAPCTSLFQQNIMIRTIYMRRPQCHHFQVSIKTFQALVEIHHGVIHRLLFEIGPRYLCAECHLTVLMG